MVNYVALCFLYVYFISFFCSYFGLSDIAGYIGYILYFSKANIEFGSSMADIYVNDIIVVCGGGDSLWILDIVEINLFLSYTNIRDKR